jgi:anti-anti-sigma factor
VSFTYPASRLVVRAVAGEDCCTLVLRGELDLASRPKLDNALARLQLERTRKLVLDLGDVSFMDSSGVHAVMTVKALCAEHGCELLVPSRSAAVERLLELTGVFAQLRHDGAIATG